jgi:hypothetical protein
VCIVGSPEATGSSSHPSPTTTPNEIHYPTIEALLQAQSTPCRVRGLFDPKKKAKVMRAWSLATLRKNNLLRTAGASVRPSASPWFVSYPCCRWGVQLCG